MPATPSDSPAPRKRAPGMSPEARRRMIVDAAIPLLAERGAAVTTGQIARAAGIGEATIFRAFADKSQLLAACAAEVVNAERPAGLLGAVERDLPLEERLTEAAQILGAHFTRIGAVIGALFASGIGPDSPRQQMRTPEGETPKDARAESFRVICEAVAGLLDPDADHLRVPAEQTATFFLSLLFANSRSLADHSISIDEIIDILLNGARIART